MQMRRMHMRTSYSSSSVPSTLRPRISIRMCPPSVSFLLDATPSEAPGKGDRGYPDRSPLTQGAGAGGEGGAGGEHVVDEQDAARRLLAQRHAGGMADALSAAPADLTGTAAAAQAQAQGEAGPLGQGGGDLHRGIEATAEGAQRRGRRRDDRSAEQARWSQPLDPLRH